MSDAARRDPFAGLPESTEFVILLPEAIIDDEARRAGLLEQMEAAFPGSTFQAVRCESLRSPKGKPFEVDEPTVIPMIGTAGGQNDNGKTRSRRPSHARMMEIVGTLRAFVGGPKTLN